MNLPANPSLQVAIPTAPIHRLTSNELVIIFSFLRDITNSKVLQPADTNIKPEWDWIVIIHICRYWRTTALGYAPLWSCLTQYICANPQMLATFIERSRNADLDVTAFLPILPEKGPLTEILQRIGRIRCLNLYIPGYLDDGARKEVQNYLAHPALRLQEFNLSGNSITRSISSITFPTISPLLKRLSLSRLSMSREVPFRSVTGLVQLKLSSIEDLTPLGFFSLLNSNPDLEIVTLEHIFWSILTQATLRSLDGVTISLPNLTHLTVHHHHLMTVSGRHETESRFGYDEILKHLDIPRESRWDCTFMTKKKETLLGMQFHQRLSQSYVSSGREILKMQVFNAGFNIEYVDPFSIEEGLGSRSNTGASDSSRSLRKSRLQVRWNESVLPAENVFKSHGIEPLLDGTPWKDARSVHIELITHRRPHHANIEEKSWISFLLKFTSVQSIELTDEISDYKNFETFLGALNPSLQEIPCARRDSLVCRNLSSLSLKLPHQWGYTGAPDKFFQTLKNTLQIRKQMGLGLKSLVLMAPPSMKSLEDSDFSFLTEFVDHVHKLES